jgi:Glycine zipper 2TM domain
LPTGTIIRALLEDSISSRHDSAGKVVMARINTAIMDRNGQVVVPADSPVQLSVTQLEPAKSRNAADGKLALQVDSVLVEGRAYPVSADVQAVPHELRGRGVSAGEAEKVGVGAAAGAVLGRVLGGNTKGTVIGGVVGAAGGAVVAAQTASRDVVVAPGTWVSFALTAPLVVKQ